MAVLCLRPLVRVWVIPVIGTRLAPSCWRNCPARVLGSVTYGYAHVAGTLRLLLCAPCGAIMVIMTLADAHGALIPQCPGPVQAAEKPGGKAEMVGPALSRAKQMQLSCAGVGLLDDQYHSWIIC